MRHVLDKVTWGQFQSTSEFGPKNLWITCRQKCITWEIIFVLAADEYLERLEGKIRKCLFFMLKYSKITVCTTNVKTMTTYIFQGLYYTENCHLNYNTTKCANPAPPAPPLQAFWNAFEFVPSTNQLAD